MFTIPINEGSRTSLPAAEVGRASAFRALLVGVPGELENVEVHFGTPDGANFACVPCTATQGGNWRVYASPIYFMNAGSAKYFVTAKTPEGDSAYLGAGGLYVMDSPQNIGATEATIVPNDTYLRNPQTGLWHRLTCKFENGVLTPTLADKGESK